MSRTGPPTQTGRRPEADGRGRGDDCLTDMRCFGEWWNVKYNCAGWLYNSEYTKNYWTVHFKQVNFTAWYISCVSKPLTNNKESDGCFHQPGPVNDYDDQTCRTRSRRTSKATDTWGAAYFHSIEWPIPMQTPNASTLFYVHVENVSVVN